MRKTCLFLLLCLLCTDGLWALTPQNLERFFPPPKQFRRYQGSLKLQLPPMNFSRPDTQTFNQAVDYNNQGLADLQRERARPAAAKFARACKLAPSEKGFWNNYLLAIRKIKGQELQAIDIAKKALALDPQNARAAHIAGLLFLNDLERPRDAIVFLNYALEKDSGNVSLATALATAYDKAGYKESAFEVLKHYAHKSQNDPYMLYMLGLQYLEREDYNPAIRAFNSARAGDDQGYAHDAWIRARFYAGQLEGLAHDCRSVLQRFTQIMNRNSLERILFALEAQDFRLEEKISVRLTRVSAIERLDFLVKPVPDVLNHQTAKLVKAEVVSPGKVQRAQIIARENDGRLRLSVPKELIRSEFILKLVHRIKTFPLLGSQVGPAKIATPGINKAEVSGLYSLDNQIVVSLAERIARQPGNYVQNVVTAVVSGLKYKENFEDHPVDWALQNPDSCDCTEFSRLLAALCLKKGYPARMVTGFLVKPELMVRETAIGHAWCEVFFAGRGWIPIDPTLQSTMRWAYFGNLLSDQIFFGEALDNRSRISIDYTSTSSETQVGLSNTFLLTNW
jgi:tetratricopeptide (TPR) repeat protein